MTDPLFVLGEGQFIIESAENFFILPVFSQPIFALNLYDTNNTLIPDGSNGVIYPDIVQGENLHFTGLTAGTLYRVQGIAIDNNTRSFLYEISPIAGLISTVTTTPPAEPNLSDVYDVTTTTCYVAWDVGTNTDTSIGYYLATIFEPGTSLATLTTSPQQITGLLPSNTYNFIVVAQNLSGERTQSGNNQQNTLPADVTDLSVDASFNVTWTDTQNVQKRYDVQLLDSSDTQIGSTLTGKLSGFKLTNLPGNTNCKVKVLVRSELSGLYSDGVTSSSFLTLPTAPTLNSIDNITQSQCNVNWTSPEETGVNYEIYTQNSDGTNQNFLIGATPSPQTISGLDPSTLFYFIVKAGNTSGSVQSSSVSFTTLSNPSITATFPTIRQPAINTNVIIPIILKNAGGSTNTTEDPANISVSGSDGSTPAVVNNEGNILGYGFVVTSATVGAVTYTITSTNFGSTSGSITWNTGGGGGGSGGGGENNGGNGHNNMAELQWKDATLAAAVSQTTEITLLGETTAAPFESVDQTILVPVSLNSLISYSGAYTSVLQDNVVTPSYPMVTVDISALMTAAAPIDAEFQDVAKDAQTLGGNSGDTLQKLFKTSNWQYTQGGMFGTSLPIEAVKDVQNKTLTCPDLVDIFQAPEASQAAGSYQVLLFEQALAAGKITAGALSDSNGTGSATFEAGDSFSVYVKYTLTKTRKFLVDDVQGTGNATITVNVGGTDVVIGSAGSEETATPIDHVVEWKFVHPA